MKYLVLITLVACTPKQTVVKWAGSTSGENVRVELQSDGNGHYTSVVPGSPDKTEDLRLTKEQLRELDDLFRSKQVCQLTRDPAYAPAPNEGQTTLELAFPDQQCTVVLWDLEWQSVRARDIAETMRSMRPLRSERKR